jgi:hypothetical protein
MKSIFSKILQGTAIAAQIANQFGFLVPPKYQPHVVVGLGIAQGIAGVIAHYYTPEGVLINPVPAPPKVE